MRYVILRRSIGGTDAREFTVYTYNYELDVVYENTSYDPIDQTVPAEYLSVRALEDYIECENTSSIPEETYEDTSFGWDSKESYDSDGRLISLWVDTDQDGTADWEITYSYYPATSNIYQKTIEDYTTKQRIQYTYNNERNIIVYEVVGTDETLDWINATKKYDHNGNLIEEGLFGPGVPGQVETIYIIGSVL